jgi:hypothetical protein
LYWDRDTDKALKNVLDHAAVGEAPAGASGECLKRVKNDWWKDYLPVSSLSNREQERLGGADAARRIRRHMSNLSKEELDRIREEFLEEKFGRKFSNGGC